MCIFSRHQPSHVTGKDALLGQANALNEEGIVRIVEQEYYNAEIVLKKALDLYGKVEDKIGIANSTKNLGVALYNIGLSTKDAGLQDEALRLLQQAMGLYDDLGDALGRVEVFNHRGFLRLKSDNRPGAHADFTTAKGLVDEVGSLLEKARALEGIGCSESDSTKAMKALKGAEKIYERIGAEANRRYVERLLNELQVTRIRDRR